jgi:hypothetical protein
VEAGCHHGAPTSIERPDLTMAILELIQDLRWGDLRAELIAIEAFCRDRPVVARDPDAAKVLWSQAVGAL